MARPSKYTPKLADKLLAQLADGKSLRTVCAAASMPSKTTVFNWLRTVDGFLDQYTRAKEESADALTDEMLDISDKPPTDAVDVNHARLKIETRKWLASKLKPKKYGDKVQTELSGVDGAPIETKWMVEFVNPTVKEQE